MSNKTISITLRGEVTPTYPNFRYAVEQLIVYVHQADYISSRPYLLFNYKEAK